jgi:hypothetical protein
MQSLLPFISTVMAMNVSLLCFMRFGQQATLEK